MVKKALSQVYINRSSGHLIELNATELKSFTCLFLSCALVELRDNSRDSHMTQLDLDL